MDLLDRLHQELLAATDEPSHKGDSPAALTIADLYQRLIPYRLVRGEVGVMELADYEHALLRLLAGERQYVRLGEKSVTMEFRRELASPHPILGIYRDHAGVEVTVLRGETEPPVPASNVERGREERGPRPSHAARSDRCPRCTRALPGVPQVRFCPFCGATQEPSTCTRCGATVQEGWNFCVQCGANRQAGR